MTSPPIVGAVYSPPPPQQQVIPEVVPMRRGRPTAGSSTNVAKPSPSPGRVTSSDPFAALDGKPPPPADELSSRFPSLDQFSLLHDGGKFDFDASSPTNPPKRDLSQRVTEKLADDAFAIPPSKTPVSSTATPAASGVSRAQKIISSNPELQSVTSIPPRQSVPAPIPMASNAAAVVSRAQKIISSNPELQSVTSPPIVYQPTPTRPPVNNYVSTGTMTSPTPPPGHRFQPASDHHRSASLPRNQESTPRMPLLHPEGSPSLQPGSTPRDPYGSQLGHARHTSSSRPSLEGGRPSTEILDPVMRTKSSNARTRPASNYLESNIDYLREKEKRLSYSRETAVADPDPVSDDDKNIESNVDFLRTMEDSELTKKDRRRSSGGPSKGKRSSLPAMSISGTKNLLAGKFGDAFKRFEHNTSAPPGPRTPSPLQEMERRDLTPIAGSEATDGRSDDGYVPEDLERLNPEQRREMERRRLSMEERRVADAAAEYRKRLADRGDGPAPKSIGGVSRATSIQNKVKNLLDENSQSSPVKKTAEGYGRFTESPAPQPPQFDGNPYNKPVVARKPLLQGVVHARTLPTQNDLNYAKPRAHPPASPATVSKTGGPRPNAPPKPMHLNSISTGPQNSPPKPSSLASRPIQQARPDMTPQEKEDYIADFSRRFPSLSGIEMVEREIEMSNGGKDDGRGRSKVI
jgi:AP2-associated kinase